MGGGGGKGVRVVMVVEGGGPVGVSLCLTGEGRERVGAGARWREGSKSGGSGRRGPVRVSCSWDEVRGRTGGREGERMMAVDRGGPKVTASSGVQIHNLSTPRVKRRVDIQVRVECKHPGMRGMQTLRYAWNADMRGYVHGLQASGSMNRVDGKWCRQQL